MTEHKKTGAPFKPEAEQGPKFSLTLTRDQWYRVWHALEATARFGLGPGTVRVLGQGREPRDPGYRVRGYQRWPTRKRP